MKPLISIIVPAHNEEEYIAETLQALKGQSYPYYEVIVVANGCTDATAAMARDKCDRLIDLPDRGLSRARNVGAAKARGDLLLFLDADTQLQPGALESIAREFTPEHSCGTLKAYPDKRKLTYWGFYLWKNLLHRSGLHCGSSGVIFCWRDQFKEAGGFNVSLNVRENSELIQRLLRFGSYKFIGSAAAVTSMRRYEKAGAKATWDWLKIWFQSVVSDLRDRAYEPIR